MKSTESGLSTTAVAVGAIDLSMHVWQLGTRQDEATEIELIASHTSDPNHLDPSCPVCHQLRAQLTRFARRVVQGVAASSIGVGIDTHEGCVVCSPTGDRRPSVTVSICIWGRFSESPADSVPAAVRQIKQALTAVGIAER